MIQEISGQAMTLRLNDAELEGDCREYHPDDGTVVQLGKDGTATFQLDFKETRYYKFALRYGDLVKDNPPSVQIMLDNRVMATTYDGVDHPPSGSDLSFKDCVSVEGAGHTPDL